MVKEAIWRAIVNGNIELLETLLANEAQDTLCECLSYAAVEGLKDIVKVILGHKVDVNRCVTIINGKEFRAITLAATAGHASIIELLLNQGAIQDKKDLMIAIRFNHIHIVKLLLERGYDPNCNSIRSSGLGWCSFSGYKEIAALLLDHGANINGSEICPNFALRMAASRGHKDIVELFLDRGATPDSATCFAAIAYEHTEIVQLLMERGGDPNCAHYAMSRSALSEAASIGNQETVKLLLHYGARINGFESEKPPITRAVLKEHKDIVVLLLGRGADINKERRGKTALTYAVRKGKEESCEILIRQMILMKSEGLHISAVNLNAAKANEKLFAFQNDCCCEIESLKSTKFDGSSLSYFDVYLIKGVDRLTTLANNENIVKIFKSGEFKNKFPIYGNVIVEHFDKGIFRKKDFELFKRFCNYLSCRVSNRLPKLPFTFVCEMFTYLNNEDIDKLRNL